MAADWRGRTIASLGLAGLASVLIIAALLVAGGPVQARKERRDDTRARDVMALAHQVGCLAEEGDGMLPASVDATEVCPFTGRLADPFTGAAYRYQPIDARSWRICAEFETPPEVLSGPDAALRDPAGCTIHHLDPPVELRNPAPPEAWQPEPSR